MARFPAEFDPKRDFVAATFFRAAGVVWERNAPFDKAMVDARILRLLYDNHKIVYADSSEQEQTDALAPVTMNDKGGGRYEISAPWLDDPIKVQGKDPATLRAQQLRDEGEPLEHHGVAIVDGGGGGWYKVNAEWLSEPESIQGKDAAYERATQLRKEGAPPAEREPEEGKEPAATDSDTGKAGAPGSKPATDGDASKETPADAAAPKATAQSGGGDGAA